MNVPLQLPAPVIYPDSDGKPVSDNTRQMQWIVVLFGNSSALFATARDVFVAGDLLWYPVEGHPEIRAAPDVLVVFGRPKGHRGSYKQWEEDNVPVTVAFEILSPKNTPDEMDQKLDFYEENGVEEYYVYNPETNRLQIWIRRGEAFRKVRPPRGFVSSRLGIRFDLSGAEMVVYRPDGRKFLSFEEIEAERVAAARRAEEAELRADRAVQRADAAERRAARLAELSRKVRRGQASEAELQELERLEEPSSGQS